MQGLVLMTTLGCHLCEQAEALLITGVNPENFYVQAQDIADDDALMEKYALRIPVLVDEASGAELGWPFDQRELQDFLKRLNAQSAG